LLASQPVNAVWCLFVSSAIQEADDKLGQAQVLKRKPIKMAKGNSKTFLLLCDQSFGRINRELPVKKSNLE
jgi:hypothetical protein